jgi:predicted phage baseplate assembly protein
MTPTTTVTEIVAGQIQTRVALFDPNAPASAACGEDLQDALPVVSLNDGTWQPQRDLLASDGFAQEFVVEIEEAGVATLRFGDNQHGLRPESGDNFTATYRVGNGRAGNIGRESLRHIVAVDPGIVGLRNPLPAIGGADPETIEEVRQNSPSAFRVQERAVTPADYAEVAKHHPDIQNAAATFRWTGSWRTVFLTIDRLGGLEVDADFKTEMRAHMERYRMAGHDLEINGPLYVSLQIEMTVCVAADYFRGDVEAALLQIFSNGTLPDGRRGLFHPDNFSFGQTFYLSPLYAAALKVEGVAAVHVDVFQRQATPDPQGLALAAGKLTLGPLEIARLDNDRNFPEHGVLRLTMEDGK